MPDAAVLIGREILQLDAEAARDSDIWGRGRRASVAVRREALVWALHVTLTRDARQPPGAAVQRVLDALHGSGPPADVGRVSTPAEFKATLAALAGGAAARRPQQP